MSLTQFLKADGINRQPVQDEDDMRLPVAGTMTGEAGAALASELTLAAADDKLGAIDTKLGTAASNLPPRMLGGQIGAVTTEAVSITGAGDDTISAAVSGQAWQMASCELSVTLATTLTFDSGGVDLVLDLPAGGVLDLEHDESGHNTGADNTLFKVSSTAGNVKGVIKLQQKAV